ncbi:MAG: FadR family transcriptional regulator [Austwickia sp.]|nr:FadR family transcriptional regulator [Actinomycetota bacterium]MCO5308076.1 FadR family transcriptional regulator [Austwickia sp.]
MSVTTRRLLAYFTGGDIQPGDRLPAERQLAASLGVGRSAVREALAALEILGVVTVRPGSGTYLKGGASELLPQTLSWGLMLGQPETHDLIEVRGALEVQAARLAAERAQPDDLARLAALVETMAAVVEDYPSFQAADREFHQLLAELSGNAVLAGLLSTTRSLIRVWSDRGIRSPEHTRLTCVEHGAVLAALRARDPQEAAEAMARHMASARERLSPT